MTRAYVEAPATHFRLSDETWALAIEDYKNGATARDVGAKWMVAPSSVYRQAAAAKSGKRNVGDARARAHARMVEEEEAATRALHPVGSRALKGLFAPAKTDQPDATDAAALARLATLASGRAMTGRLWSEAKALAGLAESYARLGDRATRGGGGTIATIDLALLLEIITDPDGAVSGRFARDPDGGPDPDAAIKDFYWERQTGKHHAVSNNMKELMLRAISAESRLKAMGQTPRVNHTDVEIEAWVRDWLSGPPTEVTVDRRTRLGEWPWR